MCARDNVCPTTGSARIVKAWLSATVEHIGKHTSYIAERAMNATHF